MFAVHDWYIPTRGIRTGILRLCARVAGDAAGRTSKPLVARDQASGLPVAWISGTPWLAGLRITTLAPSLSRRLTPLALHAPSLRDGPVLPLWPPSKANF